MRGLSTPTTSTATTGTQAIAAMQRAKGLGQTYPHPPVSFPSPCRSPGGGGGGVTWSTQNISLRLLVLLWVAVLWGTTTCIPCTHGRTFCSLSLKWNLTTQPCLPLGQV